MEHARDLENMHARQRVRNENSNGRKAYFGLRYCFYWLVWKPVPLSQPVRSETKTDNDSLARSHTFPCVPCRLHVFALSFDWFAELCVSFKIGQSSNFGLGLIYDTEKKIALKRVIPV